MSEIKRDEALYRESYVLALQKENERLTKCLIAANANHEQFERQYYLELNKVEDLTEANAAQAKRIEELEAATEHLGLTPKQAADGLARYKAQVAEIESLRKQVENTESRIGGWQIETGSRQGSAS